MFVGCNQFDFINKLYIVVSAIEITQNENENVKNSLEKSNVLEEKRKMVKQKICIKKTNMFTIINTNFVRVQLINYQRM